MGRRLVWNALLNLRTFFTEPWCMGGDLNEVRNMSERQGCVSRNYGMNDLNNFIENMELLYFSMIGRKFTWSNCQDGEKWSRIDRFLAHQEWVERYKLKLWGLPRTLSDHCPILLMEDESDWGPKPFKFYNFWFSNPSCIKVMNCAWDSYNDQGWAALRIVKKLQCMKEALKVWSKEVFGNLQWKLDNTIDQLHTLDLQAENGTLQPDGNCRRKTLKTEM